MNKKGFTLTEIVIVLSIASMLAIAITSLLILAVRTYGEQAEINSLQTKNRSAINRLKNDIMEGTAFLKSYNIHSVDIDTSNTSNTMIVAVPSIDAALQKNWIINAASGLYELDYFVFWTNPAGDLHKKVIPNALSSRKAEDTTIAVNAQISFEYIEQNGASAITLDHDDEDLIPNAHRVKVSLVTAKKYRGKNKKEY